MHIHTSLSVLYPGKPEVKVHYSQAKVLKEGQSMTSKGHVAKKCGLERGSRAAGKAWGISLSPCGLRLPIPALKLPFRRLSTFCKADCFQNTLAKV